MKIKAFFVFVYLGEWLFAPTKWDAIHRIHNTHKSISPLWGSALMLIYQGFTPLPMGIPSLRDYRSSIN